MTTQASDRLEQIVSFLRGIGIEICFGALEQKTFLPGLMIDRGSIVVDRAKLLWPGDLLHEAGHLAVTPAANRSQLFGDLPDAPPIPHAGEVEAIAWAWAASVAIGLPADVLFHEHGYHGNSSALILSFTNGVYPGVAGLCAAGIAATPEAVRAGEAAAYPNVQRWLAE